MFPRKRAVDKSRLDTMRPIKLATIGIIIILAFLAGCRELPFREASQFPDHLLVFYSAETMGELFPCGCRIPLGGLSRRGGVISRETPYPKLVLDAGSFARGNTGYDRFTAGWVLRAYREIGYTAVNLGVLEAMQTVAQLREWDDLSGGILVSANLIDEHDLPVTRTHLIREIGGIRIGITGVTTESYRRVSSTETPELILPVPPLMEVMEKFREEDVDFPVLLADVSGEELDAILEEVPGFRLIVQGKGFNPEAVMEVLDNDGRLVRMGDQGKYLGRLRLDFDDDGGIVGEESEVINLDSSVPTLSSVSELLTEYKIELRQRREEFLGDPPNPFQRSSSAQLVDILSGYAGSTFCLGCHVGYNIEESYVRHKNAWDMLEGSALTNPECLACHTTGYGIPTGLSDPYRDSHLRGVTCESCHGPGAEHVRTRIAEREGLDTSDMLPLEDPTGIPFRREVPEGVCIRCHTEEWSPDFDYETWIERVNHEGMDRPAIIDPETGERIEIPAGEEEN